MADNVVAAPGIGGATFATDDIGGVQYPRTKLTLGADGVTDGDVSASNPLPVVLTGGATSANQVTEIAALGAPADAEAAGDGSIIALLKRLRTLLGSTLTVSGTVVANLGTIAGAATDAMVQAVRDRLPAALVGGRLDVNVGASVLPTGAATSANQATEVASLASIDGKLSGALSVTGSTVGIVGNVEVTNDVGNPLPVSGTVTANIGTSGSLALEAGNLATLTAKDFATQTTLALIKAKTDNIPADPSREGGVLATAAKQDTGNASLATVAGAVLASGAMPTTITGVPALALVSDAPETGWKDGEVRPFSVNSSGRLRVSTYPADMEIEFFRKPDSICAFNIPDLTDGNDPWSCGLASPYP